MENNLNYEQTLKKIEEIIAKLENGDLGIDEGLRLFEEANGLIKEAGKTLETAKGKLSVIKDGIEKDFKQD